MAGGSSEPIALEQEGEGGSSVYGDTSYYFFSAPARQDTTYSALEVEIGGATRASFPLQNTVFVVPSMTAAEESAVRFAVAERTTAAGRSSPRAPVEVLVSAPVRQQGDAGAQGHAA